MIDSKSTFSIDDVSKLNLNAFFNLSSSTVTRSLKLSPDSFLSSSNLFPEKTSISGLSNCFLTIAELEALSITWSTKLGRYITPLIEESASLTATPVIFKVSALL